MKKLKSHTPIPWKRVEGCSNHGEETLIVQAVESDDLKPVLAKCAMPGDAAFVIRAVNSYYEVRGLVCALTTACVWALEELADPCSNSKNKRDVIAFLRGAIAKAERE